VLVQSGIVENMTPRECLLIQEEVNTTTLKGTNLLLLFWLTYIIGAMDSTLPMTMLSAQSMQGGLESARSIVLVLTLKVRPGGLV